MSRFPKILGICRKIKEHFWFYFFGVLAFTYLYGIVIRSFRTALSNFLNGTDENIFTLNPVKCLAAVFTPQGVGVIFFLFIMYALISGKWLHLITGIKIPKDERNFFVSKPARINKV